MASQNRHSQHYLNELATEPEKLYSQGFEPLLRYIDANSPMHERLGYSVSLKQDAFRLGQTPTMHFHASAFSEVVKEEGSTHFKLNNVFWGLFGINGPLPLHFTEFAIERDYRHQDQTLTTFCDIFHHRFLSLYYRSWAVSQPTVSHDRLEHDKFADWTSSFCGYTEQNESRRSGALQQSSLKKPTDNATSPSKTKQTNTSTQESMRIQTYLSGLFSIKNRSAGALRQIISEYLGQPVTISEFESDWYDLPGDARCKLGAKSASLGTSTIIGKRIFQRGYRFSILVGPLAYSDYLALVNQPEHFQMINKLTTRHVGNEFSFSIKLLINKNEAQSQPLGLGALNKNAWLATSGNAATSTIKATTRKAMQHSKDFQSTHSKHNDNIIVAYQHAC